MFGSPTLAAWGTSQWGTILSTPSSEFFLDSVAQATTDRLFSLDSVGGLFDLDRTVLLDSVAQADSEASFSLDYAPTFLDPSIWASEELAPYLLVEIQLPGGPVRVSTQCVTALGFVWDERIVNVADVLRTIGRGTDAVRIQLDDTSTDGQARFRDLFTANDPEGSEVLIYIGARGAPASQHLVVFRGRLEQVSGFTTTTVSLRVVRKEAVEDALLGTLVDEVTFPDAPEQSISLMLPIVFGSVETHEGIVTGTARVATLVRATLSWEEVLVLDSVEGFPLAGTVIVNGEQMTYAGITGTHLVAMVRGVGGTTASDIAIGSKVKLFGAFTVQFAGHALSSLRNILALLPSGDLGELVPAPQSVDPNTAVATWSEVPSIRDPDAVPTFRRIHFDSAGPGNTALSPNASARDSIEYGAFQASEISAGQLLQLVTNTQDLGQPGDIERVWLAVIFDPGAEGAPTNLIVQVDTVSFGLLNSDNVPPEVTRTDEKTGDRFYDIPAPVIDVEPPADEPFTILPSRVLWPGIWATHSRAKRVVDNDLDTDAVYMFTGVGEVQIIGNADAVFSVPDDYESPIKGTATSAKIVFVAGWDKTPLTSHFEVYLRENGEKIAGTSFVAESVNVSGIGINAISGREVFEHVIPPDVAEKITPGVEWVVHPALGVSNGLWVGVELFIVGVSLPAAPIAIVTQDSRKTVTNYLEVTDRLGIQASPGGTVVDGWDWFSDPARGARVNYLTFSATPAKIIETFYVVQFRPFVVNASTNPRVFADVEGFAPGGDPVEISKRIVTNPRPLGLGLTASDYDQAAYAQVQASLAADSVRLDFAIRRQRTALGLLSDVAEQADCRETWEDGKHRVIRLPRADQASPVVRTITDCDLLIAKSIGIGRTSMKALQNVISIRWRIYDPTGDTSRTDEIEDAASIVSFGRQEVSELFELIRDDGTAILVATRRIERKRRPRWVSDFEALPYTLDLRLGDLIALAHRDFSFSVGEVTQINLGARGMKRTKIQAIVWDK